MWKKNWLWALGATIIFIICYLATVGFENIGFPGRTRIIIFDNYFNISNWYYFFSYLPLVFVVVFLVKALIEKLKNRNANKIFIFFNAFLILFITYTSLKINWINEINNLDENTQELWNIVYIAILYTQFILICLLVIISWKTEKRMFKG